MSWRPLSLILGELLVYRVSLEAVRRLRHLASSAALQVGQGSRALAPCRRPQAAASCPRSHEKA